MVLSRGMVSCCAYRDEQHRHKMGIKIFSCTWTLKVRIREYNEFLGNLRWLLVKVKKNLPKKVSSIEIKYQ